MLTDIYTMFDSYIIISYILFTLYIGLKNIKNTTTVREYLVADKNYPTQILLIAFFATMVGGTATIGVCERIFKIGMPFVIVVAALPVYRLIMASFIIPKMHKFIDCLSVGEVMQQIYVNDKIRIYTGILACIKTLGAVIAQIVAMGHILHFMLDINYTQGAVLGSLIVIVYASLGGMKSVTATDIVQFCIMLIAIPVVCIIAVKHVGGLSHLLDSIPQNRQITATTDMSPYIFLAMVWMIPSLDPTVVQRFLISRNIKSIRKSMYMNAALEVFILLMVISMGFATLLINPDIDGHDALPYLIKEIMPIGIKGLAISGLLAAIMSTVDSYLHASVSTLVHDAIKPFKPSLTEKTELLLLRCTGVVLGIIALLIAINVDNVFDIIIYARLLWMPLITMSLILGILGMRMRKYPLYIASIMTILFIVISLYGKYYSISETLFGGVLINFISLVVLNSTASIVKYIYPKSQVRL